MEGMAVKIENNRKSPHQLATIGSDITWDAPTLTMFNYQDILSFERLTPACRHKESGLKFSTATHSNHDEN